ncbi:MAG: thioredoxin family protein [Caulobacteraceae bacterium]|nr:thioredoxin family protein [Caulobacteraceae bacterium]
MTAFALGAGGARAQEPPRHARLELVPQDRQAVPGRDVTVAIHMQLDAGWHTYWRNSGDAGLPPVVDWTLPQGWSVGATIWPAPGRMPEGGGAIMTYGWEGEVWLPVRLRTPAGARPGDTATLKARVTVLVCADICVPETSELVLALPVGEAATTNGAAGQAVLRAVAEAPGPGPGLNAAAALDGKRLRLAFTGGPLKGADPAGAYFYPRDPGVLTHAATQAIEKGPDGFTLSVEAAEDLGGRLPASIEGVLATAGGRWAVSVRPGPLPAGASGLGAAEALVDSPPPPPAATQSAPATPGGLGLPAALLLALAGGLLLNLMPCVFPVLAMKAAALARHAEAPGEARGEGLAYGAGVLTAFVALPLALLAAKAAGQAVGWGFQLQSPFTTAGLTLVMLGVGLNLSGVFHVGLSLQQAGAWNRARGLAGAFLTGALAVVVAAPCFAPFMTEAVSFGLTHGAVDAVLVFLVLGIGFAAPMTIIALSPAAARRLPRPGPWMETLKGLLAFPMYAAAAWLAWVFAQQTGSGALGQMLFAAVALALGFYLIGRAQAAQAADRRPLAAWIFAGLSLLAAGFLAASAAAVPPVREAPAPAGPEGLAAEPWSPQRLEALRAEGRPVFVNFTAAWCVTCQVNERAVLRSAGVRDAFRRTRAAYLVADWTRRDEAIARELAAHGRAGVPLYLVYGPGRAEPAVLPQLLDEDGIIRALEGR